MDRRALITWVGASNETGEYEVIGRPYTTAAGKTANVRAKRVESDVTMIRVYGARERVAGEARMIANRATLSAGIKTRRRAK